MKCYNQFVWKFYIFGFKYYFYVSNMKGFDK